MTHKPIFRLLILAGLLSGCGKDTTEQPGPGKTAAGGDAVSCRLAIGNDETSGQESETRTAYGPLTDGYFPIYWRTGDGWESSARRRLRSGPKWRSPCRARPKAKPT